MKRCIYMRNASLTAITGLFLLLSLLVGASSALAEGEEEKPTTDFNVSALTKYVSRGVESTRDSIVIQPSMTVGYKGFTANVWGNLDTKPYSAAPGKNYSVTWTETDLTLSYNKTFGAANAGVGYVYYGYAAPNKDSVAPPNTQELYVSLGLNKLLAPTLIIYKDVDSIHTWYFQLGISHTIEFNKIISLKLSATGSYLIGEDAGTYPKISNNGSPTTDKYNNFHDGAISAYLPIKAVNYVTITPTVSYVFPLCDDAKYDMQARSVRGISKFSDGDSSFVYGGLTFDLAF